MADTDKSTETKVGSWNLPTPSRVVAAPGLDHASLPEELKRRIGGPQIPDHVPGAGQTSAGPSQTTLQPPPGGWPHIQVDPGDCGLLGPAEFTLMQADPQNANNRIEVGRLVVVGKYPNTSEHWFLYSSVSKPGFGAYTAPSGAKPTDIQFALNSCLAGNFDVNSYTASLASSGNHGIYILAVCQQKLTY
jgi:hypothetical protein